MLFGAHPDLSQLLSHVDLPLKIYIYIYMYIYVYI